MVEQQYIQDIVDNKRHVNIFLLNGVKLQGTIIAFDDDAIIVSGNKSNTSQLVYKHAISTIQRDF